MLNEASVIYILCRDCRLCIFLFSLKKLHTLCE